jgi:hypothetical protein
MDERIKTKVRRLLSLAESNNVHEAANAAATTSVYASAYRAGRAAGRTVRTKGGQTAIGGRN